MGLEPETKRWLAQPALQPLWQRARERLERNGLAATGRLELHDLDDAQRLALSRLLGKPALGPRLRVELAQVDARLRVTAVGIGLVEILTVLGGPLTDRRGRREAASALREQLYAEATRSLATSGLDALPWTAKELFGIGRQAQRR